MANLSPWFDHIEAARHALDLADTWLASQQMEVVQPVQFEAQVVVGDKELDEFKAAKLTAPQLLVKFDEYRQRLDDPLRVGQALGHIFLTPQRLVNIPRNIGDPFLSKLREKLYAGLPQKFSINTIDPLSWNILTSFLAHQDSQFAHDSGSQGGLVQIITASPLFEIVIAYVKSTGDSIPYLATWDAASKGAFRQQKRVNGYLPLLAPQTTPTIPALPVEHKTPTSVQIMLDDLRAPGNRAYWKPARAQWYIQMVLEHPEESVKAFEAARKKGMLFNFHADRDNPGVVERFKRWACHCAILVRSNGIWLCRYSTFSQTLSSATLDRLFTTLFG